MSSKVFIVQENPSVNVMPAARFGELDVIFPFGSQIVFSSNRAVTAVRKKLKDFTDDDYILAMGDPAAIAITAMVGGEINNGYMKLLKWDKQTKAYYSVSIDLFGRKEKDNVN